MNSIRFYEETYIIEKAKAKRKCHSCKSIIQSKETCLKYLKKDILPDCRIIWKKENLCKTCGMKVLNSDITRMEKFRTEFLRQTDIEIFLKKEAGIIDRDKKFLSPGQN